HRQHWWSWGFLSGVSIIHFSHFPLCDRFLVRCDPNSERLRECTSEAIGDRTSENRSVDICQVASVS
ncbi:hypothetical protein, partial [Arthrospira platensis]|uniref:hypothetical protein n=1 Tax=Limnospira platensis TaxID=118562 RepID=UPI001A7E453B